MLHEQAAVEALSGLSGFRDGFYDCLDARAQRQQALQVISAAEARGQARLSEMNRQVLANLDRIITALHDNPGDQRQDHADAS